MTRRRRRVSYRVAKRIISAVIGGSLLLVGAVLLLTPGPGILTILLGLGILAAEFAWARLWLRRFKRRVSPAGWRWLRGRWTSWSRRFRRSAAEDVDDL